MRLHSRGRSGVPQRRTQSRGTCAGSHIKDGAIFSASSLLRIFALRSSLFAFFVPRLLLRLTWRYTRLADPDKHNKIGCGIGPGFLEQSVWWITRRLRRLAPLPSPSP